ncbi:MAG: WG repeat-containing protein [Aridibacter sp.]
MAAVRFNEKVGYIDKTGKFVIPARFRMGLSFNGGWAFVADDEGAYIIDKTGKVITELKE